MSRNITKLIVHCSASAFGDAKVIGEWHRERGFNSIGYHFVILNGSRIRPHIYAPGEDGLVENGRPADEIGAHCSGENENSIGICLIGGDNPGKYSTIAAPYMPGLTFTSKQFDTLDKLVIKLMNDYHISVENVIGHYETSSGKEQGKTCPNFDMAQYRKKLKEKTEAL